MIHLDKVEEMLAREGPSSLAKLAQENVSELGVSTLG